VTPFFVINFYHVSPSAIVWIPWHHMNKGIPNEERTHLIGIINKLIPFSKFWFERSEAFDKLPYTYWEPKYLAPLEADRINRWIVRMPRNRSRSRSGVQTSEEWINLIDFGYGTLILFWVWFIQNTINEKESSTRCPT
jgi:hypothetical protein